MHNYVYKYIQMYIFDTISNHSGATSILSTRMFLHILVHILNIYHSYVTLLSLMNCHIPLIRKRPYLLVCWVMIPPPPPFSTVSFFLSLSRSLSLYFPSSPPFFCPAPLIIPINYHSSCSSLRGRWE